VQSKEAEQKAYLDTVRNKQEESYKQAKEQKEKIKQLLE